MRFDTIALIALVGLVIACGGQDAQLGEGNPSDAGADGEGGAHAICTGICSQGGCVNGQEQTGSGHCDNQVGWVCDTRPCVPDAGPESAICTGICSQGGCINGQEQTGNGHCDNQFGWICDTRPCAPDASSDASSFACGTMTCGSSEYCKVESGGPPPLPDASPQGFYSCVPIPAGCIATPTCACIVPYDDAGAFSGTNACTQSSPNSGEGFAGCTVDAAGHLLLQCALP